MPLELAATEILKLAFGAMVETGFGKLTEAAIGKLRQTIKNRFQKDPQAAGILESAEQGSKPDLDQAATYLQTFLNEDHDFAQEIQMLVQQVNASSQDSITMNVNASDNSAVVGKAEAQTQNFGGTHLNI